MPKVKGTLSSPGGAAAQARAPTAGTNTAGRDITFYKRDFTPQESNTFLYRTVFLYVCFGIPGIERMLDINNINELLNPNVKISDDQVKKMIWVVCNFNHFLTNIGADSTKEQFIQSLNDAYDNPNRQDTRHPEEIAKSIATLVVRVFVAFQMRINLGNDASVVAPPSPMPAVEVVIASVSEELNSDMVALQSPEQSSLILGSNATKMEEINTAVGEKIEKINEGSEPESTRRISNRVRLLNEALGREAAERKAKQAAEAEKAEAAKREKIRVETERLQECIASFGQSIKFIEPIPAGIHKEFPIIKFEPTQFYKLLPKVLARMISSINRRIVTTEIKPGPGTAETLNSLGLPDPGIKIQVDDEEDEEEQGGGSSSRSRRFCITKRKKNNKILRRLNSKNKKNPRNILYGGRGGVRQFVEHAQPIPQCESTIGNYHKYVNPTCYICGEPWIKGVQSSMECEHILCVIHGIEYYGLLQSVYLSEEQKNFLSILYAWAHRCCNQRKRNIAFIRKNPSQEPEARGNYFVPDDVNIRELLSDIFTLSTYLDSNPKSKNPKSKFDCNKILKKVKDNKKQFVDKRTAVVTSYVTPLVACINTVFTGLFAANMVLFNAIGCLKIIAEMSIYLTAVGKKDPKLQLEFAKTATFMSEIVFPGCERVSAGGGGRRIIHDKKTRKSLRRKIQRGGAPEDIINAINGLLAQEEYEKQMYDFKNAVDVAVEQPGRNPSSRMLSNTLNDMFPGQPSPSEPPSPPPRLDAPLTRIEDSTKIDAILFILFVLNHSRNPTILLGLFLDLKEQGSIVREETGPALSDAEDEPEPVPPVDVGANITQSLAAYQTKRQVNKTAFIDICRSVFTSEATTIKHITEFLTDCDMMPSFVGVVMFCARQTEFTDTKPLLESIIHNYMSDIPSPRVAEIVIHKLKPFETNIGNFLHKLQGNHQQLFTSVDVPVPTTPLDHLVNACFHLKQIMFGVDPSVVGPMLLHACYLFPSCFDEDIFSQFGPCAAYSLGVLEVPNFQAALGCVASAKTMCAKILIDELQVTPSKHSHDDQRVALELFYGFFDKDDKAILSRCYTGTPTPTPTPAILSSSSFGSGLATHQTGNIVETINKAIENFGKNIKNDATNFVYIIIGMNWENGTLSQGEIPMMEALNRYIREQLLANQTESENMLASYLIKKGNPIKHEQLVSIIGQLFIIIESKLSKQKVKRDSSSTQGDPATVQKRPSGKQSGLSEQLSGNPHSSLIYLSDDEQDSQYSVVKRIDSFVRLLLAQRPISDSPQEPQLFRHIETSLNKLMVRFKNMFTSASQLTQNDMISYLTQVIDLLLPQPSAPPSPSSGMSQSDSPPRYERSPQDSASEILKTYNYFQDESFEEDDISVVYDYIVNPGRLISLKVLINTYRVRIRNRKQLQGGSSPHNTKRQHRKKQKIKSRRKNKYNTTKTRKNRNS